MKAAGGTAIVAIGENDVDASIDDFGEDDESTCYTCGGRVPRATRCGSSDSGEGDSGSRRTKAGSDRAESGSTRLLSSLSGHGKGRKPPRKLRGARRKRKDYEDDDLPGG